MILLNLDEEWIKDARKRIEENYSIGIKAQRYLKVYKEMINLSLFLMFARFRTASSLF